MKPFPAVVCLLATLKTALGAQLAGNLLETVVVFTCASNISLTSVSFVSGPAGTSSPGAAITVTQTSLQPTSSNGATSISTTSPSSPSTQVISSTLIEPSSTIAPIATTALTITLQDGRKEVIYEQVYEVTTDGTVSTFAYPFATSFVDRISSASGNLGSSSSSSASDLSPTGAATSISSDSSASSLASTGSASTFASITATTSSLVTTTLTVTPDPVISSTTVTSTASTTTVGSTAIVSQVATSTSTFFTTVTPVQSITAGTTSKTCFASSGHQTVGYYTYTPVEKRAEWTKRVDLASTVGQTVTVTDKTLSASTITQTFNVTITPRATVQYSTLMLSTSTINSTSTVTAPTSTATLIYATVVPEGIDSYWFSASWGNEEVADLNSVITTLKTYDRGYISSYDSQAPAGKVSDLNLEPSGQNLILPSGRTVGATNFAMVFQGWFWPPGGAGKYLIDVSESHGNGAVWVGSNAMTYNWTESNYNVWFVASGSGSASSFAVDDPESAIALTIVWGGIGGPSLDFVLTGPNNVQYSWTQALVADCNATTPANFEP